MPGSATAVRLGRALPPILAVAILYAVTGAGMLLVARATGLAAPLWPAAGLAFAVVYQRGRSLALGVALGSFVLNAATITSGQVSSTAFVATAALIATGAALQALAGDSLVRRFLGRRLLLDATGQILAFLALAGPVACVVNASVGVAAQLATGVIAPSEAALGWVTWWAGDSAGVIVFAPIVLMLLPEQRDIWDQRRWKVAVPSMLVTVVLLGAFVYSRGLEERRVEMREQQVSEVSLDALSMALSSQSEVLQSIGSFVSSSQFVSVDEFRGFTASALERHPSLQALAWDVVVPERSLDAFVAQQRSQPGLAGFQVTQRDASGALVPAGQRPEYVVVGYIEPLASSRAGLGFDIASDPTRRAAFEQARDSGRLTSSAPVSLVIDTTEQPGMLVLLPVYAGGTVPPGAAARRESLIGLAAGVVRIHDLVASTLTGSQWDKAAVTVTDVTDRSHPVALARRAPLTGAATSEPYVRTLDVNGRTWDVGVALTDDALDDVRSSNVAVLLVAAVLVIGLLEAFLLLVTGLERRARREAEALGFEAVHDPLTAVLNRRGFERALQVSLERHGLDGSEHVLMYLDLDGFRDVNTRGGHQAGDALLARVGRALQSTVRRGDAVGRLGGDEFGVLLVDCGIARGSEIAEQIVAAVSQAVVDDLGVTVSVGAVPVVGGTPGDVQPLIRAADAACFEAKHGGGGRVCVHAALR